MLLLRKRLDELLSVSEEVGVVFEQVSEVPSTSEVFDELRLLLGEPEERVTDFLFLFLERVQLDRRDRVGAVDCRRSLQVFEDLEHAERQLAPLFCRLRRFCPQVPDAISIPLVDDQVERRPVGVCELRGQFFEPGDEAGLHVRTPQL